jgi:hypothetical protein
MITHVDFDLVGAAMSIQVICAIGLFILGGFFGLPIGLLLFLKR